MTMLRAKNISVSYQTQMTVDTVSCTLKPGELIALIGPNGSGKSSLLKAIMGFAPKTSGYVMLNDRLWNDIPRLERARLITFLPQERIIEWRLRVRDIVMLGRYPYQTGFFTKEKACETVVNTVMEETGIAHLEHQYADTLSGGEKLRTLLARALAVQAPYFLADEPIAELDPFYQLQIMTLLRQQANRGKAILVVMHDLLLASRFADRLILLSEGKKLADGCSGSVLTPNLIEQVYHVIPKAFNIDGSIYQLPWQLSGS